LNEQENAVSDGRDLGVFLPYESSPSRFAQAAEAAGFDRLAYGEHVLFRRPMLNAFIALAAASSVTARIRLLSALTLLPLYPPALAAKFVSSLDVVSDGRFDFGVGVGGEFPAEFEVSGVDLPSRGRRTDATLVAMRELFTGEAVAHVDGETDFAAASELMRPKPVQQPQPPIWVGGRSERAMSRAAQYGDVWLPYLMTAERLTASAEVLSQRAADFGRTTAVRIAVSCFVYIDSDESKAARESKAYVSKLYDIEEDTIARHVITGSSEQVAGRLTEFYEAGATHVLLNMCAEGTDADAMLVRGGNEVGPLVRA
jgi:alkanesulfonate monooxygenase SsuD/methylene tetrahydromethanopterin reductase-like flavin-dependent oxidoreductase (luciferase family)